MADLRDEAAEADHVRGLENDFEAAMAARYEGAGDPGEPVDPAEEVTVTLTRAEWEDITGALWRAAADCEHAADLPDYEPDEQRALRGDAASYRAISPKIEAAL